MRFSKKLNQNILIDFIAFVAFLLLTTTGILMRYLLPPGSGRFTTIWGMDRHDWGGIHFWISVAFFATLTLHLILHWRWIVRVLKGLPKEESGVRFGLGIVGIFAVAAMAMSPLISPIEVSQSGSAGYGSEHIKENQGILGLGAMNLRELSAETGVPIDHLIQELDLPESVSRGEQLGRLRREYGFEMDQVRSVIDRYKKSR